MIYIAFKYILYSIVFYVIIVILSWTSAFDFRKFGKLRNWMLSNWPILKRKSFLLMSAKENFYDLDYIELSKNRRFQSLTNCIYESYGIIFILLLIDGIFVRILLLRICGIDLISSSSGCQVIQIHYLILETNHKATQARFFGSRTSGIFFFFFYNKKFFLKYF